MTFFKDENGQGMVEYALIVGLIAVVLLVAFAFIGRSTKKKLNESAFEFVSDYSGQ
ncbi:MAG: Flp family type IVb pilin [Eubacterium sp.]|nr:Flp family type IVb pilin [Eubacterium sp.]